jgi:hypothetical protein
MKRVSLTRTEQFSYYLLPIILVAIGFIPFYYLITGQANENLPARILVGLCVILFLSAFAFFLWLRRSLKFISIISDQDIHTKTKVIRKILRDHHWSYKKNTTNFIQAVGGGFRDEFDMRTWSDQLTITILSDKILVNCICEPVSAQPFTFGKSKRIVKDFEILFRTAIHKIVNKN